MIIISVKFAETNASYDFKVDETENLKQLIEEIVGMIAEKEHLKLEKNSGLFLLCDQHTGRVFNSSQTLAEYQVGDGDSLLLV